MIMGSFDRIDAETAHDHEMSRRRGAAPEGRAG
jgi:hypothetical protein